MVNTNGLRRIATVALSIAFCAAICSACSQMASQYGIKPAVSYDIRGKVQDEVYSSMDSTYQIHIPPLLKPGAKIFDNRYSDKLNGVSMTDDLCRQFIVFERIPSKEVFFNTYVEEAIKDWITRSKSTIVEQREMDTPLGRGLYWRMTLPKGAPCITISFVDGKRKEEQPDADNAILFVQSGGRVYQFSYVLGPMGIWPVIKTGPAEEVLMEFVGGFKQLK